LKVTSINTITGIGASGIGLADSIYLIILKVTNNQTMCLKGLGDCWSVNLSPYSEIYGIPVSVFGALAYFLLLILLIPNVLPWFSAIFKNQLAFGITFAGFIFSIYLTYLEIAVIKALCPFCIVSAVMMTVLFIITLLRLVQNRSEYTLSLEDKNG
jgi:uncharacterized membrane protein